ncbi:MAG: HypC/HybG/HupF family hydrogenase formation chaperone [Lentisphaerae bacterium]|nr:HypC/HybG/HupF family hydrogenase formation chaperone [Lentisphaerota bacterium]MBR2872309.1 HypC/HybG/HupF family hydrogenase formation chaperone [Lentisphaeria bacterium]
MCIAWPMRVSELLEGHYATAEIDGIFRRISLRLLDEVNVGDYVLVHAGFAIEKIDFSKAREQLEIMEELKKGILPE